MGNTNGVDRETWASHQAIVGAVRDSYGRLLSFLASRSFDLSAAADALADAFKSALETWPQEGVPDNRKPRPGAN